MLYLGWIIAAFLAGVLLTLAVTLRLQRRRTLRQRFDGLGMTAGRDYAEIAAAVRAAPQETRAQADGQTLRTRREGAYAISLLFDRFDNCLGVMEEHD